ncbi:MAG: FkbM family methyltransferase [Planctomycetota bacterium]
MKQIYYDVYEPELIDAMKKFLKKGDTFIDVGASVGYISAVAAAIVGKTGQVHSFEPVPEYFDRLKKFAMSNEDYNIIPNQSALGKEEGKSTIDIAGNFKVGWNTMVANSMPKNIVKATVQVPVIRLDKYIKDNQLDNISLIKVDTEGYEFFVFQGLSDYFTATKTRAPIICEISPRTYAFLDFTLTQLSEYMKGYGYNAFSIFNTAAEIDITKLRKITNVVFVASSD